MTTDADAMPPRKRLRLLVVLVAGAVALWPGCKRQVPLAVLQEVQGHVLRDHAAARDTWLAAERDHTFLLGDGVKTAVDGEAMLRLADGSRLKMRPQAILRFQDSPADERRFDLEMGEVMLELAKEPMRLRSDIGLAVIEPGTHLVIRRDGAKARYEVVVGMATFQQPNRPELHLQVGQRIVVDLATAEIETPPEPEPPPATTSVPKDTPSRTFRVIVKGRRVRQRTQEQPTWQALAAGPHALSTPTEFDLPTGASMVIERGDENAVAHGAARFVVGGDDALITARSGRITFDGPRDDTTVAVPGGRIIIRGAEASTRGDVVVSAKKAALVNVHEGLVIAESKVGSDEIAAGESLALSPNGAMDVRGRGPDVADLVVAAGESSVVHDPTPPTAIQVDFGARCPQSGRLRIGSRRLVLPRPGAKTTAIAVLPAGAYRYAILCGSESAKPAAEGSLQVIRDDGTARLPRIAPASLIDTDGRNYTILYQNLLPEVQVRWPTPPKADAYELTYQAGPVRKTVKLSKANHVFKPGTFAEGNYGLTFAAFARGREVARSAETTVKIRFDNAAPAAVVRAPANRQFKPGETVDVAGIALPGWQVSSMGDALTLDPHHRFFGQVLLAPHQRTLAIRFEHRDRGVHYYLRRPGGKVQ